MRCFFQNLTSVLAVFTVLVGGQAVTTAQSTDFQLTLLHTNDTHGHLLPYSYPEHFSPGAPEGMLVSRRDIGGAARRSTLVKKVRAEKGHDTLLIDSGDICDGTPFSTEYHGSADVAVMNTIGYDIACPGNHEYNNTLAQVKTMAAAARFQLISANSTVRADGKLLYTPYIIRNIQGTRVAFFGLMTYDARTYPAAKTEVQMEEPIAVAKQLVPELRKQADFVVAVTHIGVDEDVKLAAEVPGIDVIVGGHTHTLLPHPLFVPRPLDTSDHSVHGTVIVQDFQWAGTLGRLDLKIHHEKGHAATVATYSGKLLPITAAVPEDKQVADVIKKYWDPISAKYARKIGETADDITTIGDDLCEYNIVADAVKEKTGADFVMENLGGVRAPYVRGSITYGDAITADPFGNKIVTFKASGVQIKKMLLVFQPAVAGLAYTIDHGKLTRAEIAGQPIEDSRTYSGATNTYLAQTLLKDIPLKVTTENARLDASIQYITRHSPVHAAYDGRRKISE